MMPMKKKAVIIVFITAATTMSNSDVTHTEINQQQEAAGANMCEPHQINGKNVIGKVQFLILRALTIIKEITMRYCDALHSIRKYTHLGFAI
jgi:hypothetical protein